MFSWLNFWWWKLLKFSLRMIFRVLTFLPLNLYNSTVVFLGTFFFLKTWLYRPPIQFRPPKKESLPEYINGELVASPVLRVERPAKQSKHGYASDPPVTVLDCLRDAALRHALDPAISFQKIDGTWAVWTWADYRMQIENAAKGFIQLGLQPWEVACIMGFNSPEFFVAHLGAMMAALIPACINFRSNPTSAAYIIEHSKAKVLIVSTAEQRDIILAHKATYQHLRTIIQWSGSLERQAAIRSGIQLMSWGEFISLGQRMVSSEELLDRTTASAPKPGQCCSLVYTSGNVEVAKAVMLTHDNLTWVAKAGLALCAPDFAESGPERIVSYLPLNHIAAQMFDIYAPIVSTSIKPGYCTVYFARPDAFKGSLTDTLRLVKPTFFFGIPHIWEKMEERILQGEALKSDFEKKLINWGMNVGLQAELSSQVGGSGDQPVVYPIAKKLVFNKLAEELGLDNCKHFASGAAPLKPETQRFFASRGIRLLEMYGLTECTGLITACNERTFAWQSCGVPLPGCEIKVSSSTPTGMGEILVRGRGVMLGYLNDAESTNLAIDQHGWLHTGDQGHLDQHGLLHVKGRSKDMIVTSTGERIAPQSIERVLKSFIPGVQEAIVVGDGQKYITALFNLETDPGSNRLAGKAQTISPISRTIQDAQNDAIWMSYLEKGVRKYNEQHAADNAHKIHKFAILPEVFLSTSPIEEGILSGAPSSSKERRSMLESSHPGLLESMYRQQPMALS